MRWGYCAVALFIALGTPALAQPIVPGAQFYTLADLKVILVQNQQYFVLDNEGTSDASVNHLHFSRIDTTTGDFAGELTNPALPEPFTVPATAIPVTGTITITPGTDNDFATGVFYGITFSWNLTVGACEDISASYTAAITFKGYEGSGKMHAVIAGIENAFWGACGVGDATFNPVPFSGQLTK